MLVILEQALHTAVSARYQMADGKRGEHELGANNIVTVFYQIYHTGDKGQHSPSDEIPRRFSRQRGGYTHALGDVSTERSRRSLRNAPKFFVLCALRFPRTAIFLYWSVVVLIPGSFFGETRRRV